MKHVYQFDGVLALSDSGVGVGGLLIGAVDVHHAAYEGFEPTVTGAAGDFQLQYAGHDIDQFERGEVVLHLRVSTLDGDPLLITPDPVAFPASGKGPCTISLPADRLPTGFASVRVVPLRAGLGRSIRVTAIHRPGAQMRFSIDGLLGAGLVTLDEDARTPGVYHGSYEVQPGDRANDAEVTVLLADRRGSTGTWVAPDLVSLDGVPPVLSEPEIEPSVVRNGEALHLRIDTETDARVVAHLARLDTGTDRVSLEEEPDAPGTYSAVVTISRDNACANGTAPIAFDVVDAFGNRGDRVMATVELRNSELDRIDGLSVADAASLDRAGVVTLSDLRRIDTEAVARETGVDRLVLRRSQAVARLDVLGIGSAVATELYDSLRVHGPSALAFVARDELAASLADAAENGRLRIDDPEGLARDLIGKGTDVYDVLAGRDTRDRVRSANRCEGHCAPANSALGCLAYVLDLLRAAGFTETAQLRLQFGWDLASVDTAPLRRVALCISILEATVQVDHQHPSQKQYEHALHRVLVGQTGKTTQEIATDPAYAAAMRAATLHERNDLLAQAVQANVPSAEVDKALQALEPRYLRALIDQSGKTPEELLERYGLSFSTHECEERTSCEQAILVLQRYLREKANEAGVEIDAPLLTYDTWRQEKAKHYYPENVYAILFKDALIGGERDALRRHLAEAKSILSTVRLTDGRAPSPEDTGALLTSYRNRNPYYQNISAGLDLIERCIEIDDQCRAGHNAYFTEEYSLAQYHYYRAARLIRQVCRSLSKGLVLPAYSRTEPELPDTPATKPSGKPLPNLPPGSGWIGGPSTTPDHLLDMTPSEVRTALLDFGEKLIYSYLPGNVPGVDLGRGQIPLSGVDPQGTFLPIYDTYTGPTEGAGRLKSYLSHFQKHGWTEWLGTVFSMSGGGGFSIPGERRIGWAANKYGNVSMERVNTNATVQSALVYDVEDNLDNVVVEAECVVIGGCDCGVVFNWRDPSPNSSTADVKQCAGYAGVDLSSGEARVGWLDDMKLTTVAPIRPIALKDGDLVRIRVRVEGGAVRANFEVNRNKAWQPLASIPASESLPPVNLTAHIPAKGKVGLYVFEYKDRPAFSSVKVWDLSPTMGVFSDGAFFLEPGYPAEVTLPPHIKNPRPKHYFLLASPTSAYATRQYTPQTASDTARFVGYLPKAIALDYDSNSYLVSENVVDAGFDPFFQVAEPSVPTAGLWYGRGDKRLLRDNLGMWLDLLPNLFIHQYFFMLPICLGDAARALGQYEDALAWYRLVYDDRPSDEEQRPVYRYLNRAIEGPFVAQRIAENDIEWADHLFRRNTQESTQEARLHYRRALDLLDGDDCCGLWHHRAFSDITVKMLDGGLPPEVIVVWRRLAEWLTANPQGAKQALSDVNDALTVTSDAATCAEAVRRAVSELPDPLPERLPRPRSLAARLDRLERTHADMLDAFDTARTKSMPSPMLDLPSYAPTATPVAGGETTVIPAASEGTLEADEATAAATTIGLVAATWSAGASGPTPSVVDWVNNVVSGSPGDFALTDPGRFSGRVTKYYPDSKIDFTHDLCIPPNPFNRALIERACLGIRHIDLCFNALGYPHNDVSSYRFDFLIHLANQYAALALAAEKDFIQFKEKFESDTLEVANADQAVSLSQAGARLADLSYAMALDGVAAAALEINAVSLQIQQVEQRLAELRSDESLRVLGIVVAAGAAVASAGTSGLAMLGSIAGGVGKAAAGVTDLLRGLDESEQLLRFQLQRLRVHYANAASLSLVNAEQHRRSAEQQALVARLQSQFAAERAAFLRSQFLNPQLWSFLATEVKRNYRAYLDAGILAAWLAQRALEYEMGVEPRRRFAASWPPDPKDQSLDIIRFDYYRAAQQGLLAADGLLADITALEQHKLLNDQRKLSITKVISIAQTDPLAFEGFLEGRRLLFGTTQLDFDLDYQGHYQRRIKRVRLNVYGLVGMEGIRATLSNPGPTSVVVREWDDATGAYAFVEKTLAYPQASVALTNPQPGGIGARALAPETRMLEPFEGMGVAGQWAFEMLPASNTIDLATITDVQLVIDYTALADDQYRREVLKRLPTEFSAIRPYSFCRELSDACFHLMDVTRPLGMITTTDGLTGSHTLQFATRAGDFPPNAHDLVVQDITVYVRSSGSQSFAGLKLYLACGQRLAAEHLDVTDLTLVQPIAPTHATMVPATVNAANYDPAPHYIGRWRAADLDVGGDLDVADTWYLCIPPSENAAFIKRDAQNQPVTVGGRPVLDLTGAQDVVFALHYTYNLDIPDN